MIQYKKEIGPFLFYKNWQTWMGGSDMTYCMSVKILGHTAVFSYSRPLWRG